MDRTLVIIVFLLFITACSTNHYSNEAYNVVVKFNFITVNVNANEITCDICNSDQAINLNLDETSKKNIANSFNKNSISKYQGDLSIGKLVYLSDIVRLEVYKRNQIQSIIHISTYRKAIIPEDKDDIQLVRFSEMVLNTLENNDEFKKTLEVARKQQLIQKEFVY